MSSIEQNSFQLALIQFCEQRAQIEVLGRHIGENVRKFSLLQQQVTQATTHKVRSPGNVFELSVVRLRADMGLLVSDTQRLAKLAGELHMEFIEVAARYLTESRLRMARLISAREQHGKYCTEELGKRIDAAVLKCNREIDQIMGLIERTGSSVALLTVSTEQFSALATG
ncbi:hypothetical protein QN362_11395 [Actimicrobium sp. CCC2.4]|uniref:hypothetical protein n=1 Tax=Actimicrobium sp. CCC2.4 TaxID=3048606 RepID=UPI002AC93C20|nr:hypothetical protein [Actimicrobium sp. CCC2.4]MEB0135933.1 hypothetical protein [Actimicrobium sp. CCC2.4]WPX32599.1 hypothetical protein RHM62_01755 [Actimicrobium sp. CCC2.4]